MSASQLRLCVTVPDDGEAMRFWGSLNARLEGAAGLLLTDPLPGARSAGGRPPAGG